MSEVGDGAWSGLKVSLTMAGTSISLHTPFLQKTPLQNSQRQSEKDQTNDIKAQCMAPN